MSSTPAPSTTSTTSVSGATVTTTTTKTAAAGSTSSGTGHYVSIASAPKPTAPPAPIPSATSNPASPTVPVSTAFTGAINLTIANGAININPSQPQVVGGPVQGIKANIGNSGSLQRLPIQTQTIPANLVRHQTLNVRIAANNLPRPLVGPRTMVIGSAQLRGQSSIVLGNLGSGTLILPSSTKVSPGQLAAAQMGGVAGGGNLPGGKVPLRAATTVSKAGVKVTLSTSAPTSTALATPIFTVPVSSLPLATQQQLQQQNPLLPPPQSVLVASTTVAAAASTSVAPASKVSGPGVLPPGAPTGVITMPAAAANANTDKKAIEASKVADKKTLEKKLLGKKRKASQDEQERKDLPDKVLLTSPAEKQDGVEKTVVVSVQKKTEKSEAKKTISKPKKTTEKKMLPVMEKKDELKPNLSLFTPTKQEKSDVIKVPLVSDLQKQKTAALSPSQLLSRPSASSLSAKKVVQQAKETEQPVTDRQTGEDIQLPLGIDDQNSSPVKEAESADNGAKKEKTVEQSIEEMSQGKDDEDLGLDDILGNSDSASGSNSDLHASLVWKNGIGTLPGSSIKFRMNEFGILEMVSADMSSSEQEEKEQEDSIQHNNIRDSSLMEVLVPEEGKTAISKCESCGIYGRKKDFMQGTVCNACVSAKKGVDAKVERVKAESLCKPPSPPAAMDADTASVASSSSGSSSRSSSSPPPSTGAGGAKAKKRKRAGGASSPVEESDAKLMKLEGEGSGKGKGGDGGNPPAPESSTGAVSEDDDKLSTCSQDSQLLKASGARKHRGWTWNAYLEKTKALKMPVKMFKEFQQVPSQKNGFKVGMKLEGIDPSRPALYCVLSVAEVKGFRIRLHFDSYPDAYDFWLNANSPFIFPPGWAEKNGKQLQPPKQYVSTAGAGAGPGVGSFSWAAYLKESKSPAAPKHLFANTSVFSVTPHAFRHGMKLEAVDKKNSDALVCVATVADVLGDKILIHFDGWDDIYDYWSDPTSPYLHPVGWCQANGVPLSPPNDWPDIKSFTWEKYLAQTKSQSVPARAFKTRAAPACEVGMKLEAMDRRNPQLLRPASVTRVDGHTLHLAYDGWPPAYDVSVEDDDYDIHPVGWCAKTGHPLQVPPGERSAPAHATDTSCPTPGCTGVGHIKGPRYANHHSESGCPYSECNMSREEMPDRLGTAASSKRQEGDGKAPTDKHDPLTENRGPKVMQKGDEKLVVTDPQLTQRLRQLNNGRPVYGPGSGRGRKSHKLLKLLKEQAEAIENGKVSEPSSNKSLLLHKQVHDSVFMSGPAAPPPPHGYMVAPPSQYYGDYASAAGAGCYDMNSKVLADDLPQQAVAEITRWTAEQVQQFIRGVRGCSTYAHAFVDEQVDGEAFLMLEQDDLITRLKIKMGPALKIINIIIHLRKNRDIDAALAND